MSKAERIRKEAKRQRRQAAMTQRRADQRRRDAQRHRRSLALYGGAGLAVVAIIGTIVWSKWRSPTGVTEVPAAPAAQGPAATPGSPASPAAAAPAAASLPGSAPASPASRPIVVRYPEQGRDHVPLGAPHPAYNSNPPTSGWHTPETAPWGWQRTTIPDEVLIHNLEHGGIWISYRDPSDTALAEKLERLVSRYRSKVIVTPRPGNDSPIAVAAWGRLLKLQTFDEQQIVAFINAYKNKGPERVPD